MCEEKDNYMAVVGNCNRLAGAEVLVKLAEANYVTGQFLFAIAADYNTGMQYDD